MPFVWQISVVHFKDKSFINGVILEGLLSNKKGKVSSFRNFSSVIGSYSKKPYAEKKIILHSNKKQLDLITDKQGGFSLFLDSKIDTGIKIFIENQSTPLKINQTYPVNFEDSDHPICIISDVDDTILVSHTANVWKRMSTILFVTPNKRKSISFTREILNNIKVNNGRIFYVSKSESNLFGMLTTFIENNNLPAGNLMLTPYLRFMQLLNPKKGKYYKERMIKSILDNSPEKKFILMGDDTQQDIAVYTRIAELYPRMIIKIYIRKTRKNLLGNKKEQMNKLSKLAVPTLYFEDVANSEKEISFINTQQNH